MGRMVFRPVSDIDVSNIGGWEKSNSRMSCAAALINLDDEYIYMEGRAKSNGTIKLQLALDESTRPDCFSFHIKNIGIEGIYSSGNNLKTGTIDTTLDLLSNSFTNSTGTSISSKLEYQLSLSSSQTNAHIAAQYFRGLNSNNTYIDELRDFGPMTLQLSGVHAASSLTKSGAFSLDQLFIYVDYEPVFLSIKQNGTWVECSNVYQKVNGIWVEQDVDFLGYTNKNPAFQTFTNKIGPILSPIFSENSWEDIATACELKMVPTSWQVGDEKIMTLNGEAQKIVILDKFHDYYSSNKTFAPLTFGMRNCLKDQISEAIAVTTAEGRERLINYFPENLQMRLKPVYKHTTIGYGPGWRNDICAFPFCRAEINGQSPAKYDIHYSDRIYEYYKTNDNRIKTANNENCFYWLREYENSGENSGEYLLINSNDNDTAYIGERTAGISFGFCF